MLLPRKRLRFLASYQGKASPEGFIEIDLSGFEMEGLKRLVLTGSDLEALKKLGDKQASRLDELRSLMGAEEEEDEQS